MQPSPRQAEPREEISQRERSRPPLCSRAIPLMCVRPAWPVQVDFSLIVEREDPFLKNFPISAAHHKLPLKKKLAAFAGADCT